MHPTLIDPLLNLLNLPHDRPMAVLDIGCGSGALLQALGRRLGPGSRRVGLDANPAAITAAQAADSDGSYRVHKFVDTLPCADDEFDWVFSADLLECIPDQASLLAETARVLRPGGQVVCVHWDWDTAVYAGDDPAALRRLVHAYADWQQGWMEACDGMMGRKLWGIFQGSSLFQGRVVVLPLVETVYAPGQWGHNRLADLETLAARGEVDAGELAQIRAEMAARAAAGRYFYSLNAYVYIGVAN